MALKWLLQSRSLAPIVSIALWCLAIGILAELAWTDNVPALRHPAVLMSAELVIALMAGGWCAMIANPRTIILPRLLWTLGLITLLFHIILAFWLAHRWSHGAAVEHVREVGGYGIGIVANYLFALIWLVDVAWWWIEPASHAHRPRWMAWTIHGFLAFILLNATVIFGAEERRLIYGAFLVAIAVLGLIVRMKRIKTY